MIDQISEWTLRDGLGWTWDGHAPAHSDAAGATYLPTYLPPTHPANHS